MVEGTHIVAAILIETVVGTNGILVPPDGYLKGVREICDKYGVVMICDEVMAGFGRCGEWFAVDRWNVTPDLIAFAKGSNSGYLPVGGVIISRPIADTFKERPFHGGLTYSGHPLACSSAQQTDSSSVCTPAVFEHRLQPGLVDLAAGRIGQGPFGEEGQ